MAKPREHHPHEHKKRKHQLKHRRKHPGISSIADAVILVDQGVYLACRHDASIPSGEGQGFGLYHHDCRYLSRYEVALNGEALHVLASSSQEGFRGLFHLANATERGSGSQAGERHTIGVQLNRLVAGERQALIDRYAISNYSLDQAKLRLEFAFDADFQDVFGVRQLLDLTPGQRRAPRWRGAMLTFAYDGADGILRAVDLSFSQPASHHGSHGAVIDLVVGPGETVELLVTCALTEARGKRARPRRIAAKPGTMERSLQQASGDWLDTSNLVGSDAPLYNRVIEQSLRDLHALRMTLNEQAFFAAGVPWYVTLFGRDSLISAMQVLAYDPSMAEQTLRLLATYQGRGSNAWCDEDAGKIPHELRVGELAHVGEIPQTPSFDTVDATPLFLIVLAEHARWTGRLDLFQALRPNVEAALRWLDQAMAASGFLTYGEQGKQPLNHGWKDSVDAICNADGSLAEGPIALVEVQGYVYRAWLAMARLFERAGEPGRARQLRQAANRLALRFRKAFWLAGRGTYALALQGNGKPVAVVASNAGQALWGGIASQAHARDVVQRLMQADSFSGWGVRTLASGERRYNPIGYHLGTVWPHDNALIAAGFRNYGFHEEAHRLHESIFEAATHFDLYRLPELFAGLDAQPFGEPVRYPVACHPQAWASGSLPYMLVTSLGLAPDGFAGCLRIHQPRLLNLIGTLTLTGLRVGEASVDLRFHADDGHVEVEVLHTRGDVAVVREDGPSPV